MVNVSIPSAESLAHSFQILGPPVRVRLLLAIGEHEVCICHLDALLGQRQAFVSQHLMRLRALGAVVSRREGTCTPTAHPWVSACVPAGIPPWEMSGTAHWKICGEIRSISTSGQAFASVIGPLVEEQEGVHSSVKAVQFGKNLKLNKIYRNINS